MIWTVHCKACDRTWDFQPEPGQTIYMASLQVATEHQFEPYGRNGADCWYRASKSIELVGVK